VSVFVSPISLTAFQVLLFFLLFFCLFSSSPLNQSLPQLFSAQLSPIFFFFFPESFISFSLCFNFHLYFDFYFFVFIFSFLLFYYLILIICFLLFFTSSSLLSHYPCNPQRNRAKSCRRPC
jgi:hypothetical protein